MKKVLAIDMGATSIRGIISYIKDEKIHMKEVMRINHSLDNKDNRLRWEWDKLISTIVDTIIDNADEIESVAVDTWGVDFGYLDESMELINNPISYRDPKHIEGYKYAISKLSEKDIFLNTGTQIMSINTIFQLLALKNSDLEEYKKIKKILMLPDLISYLLCGEMVGEETIWSTTGIMDLSTKSYSTKILKDFDIDEAILPNLTKAGKIIGSTKNSKIEELKKYDIKIISVCGHDTASAVLLTKAFSDDDYMFLSCGTWSLFGTRVDKAKLSQNIFEKNLTNELCYNSNTLLFKNITGLYLFEKYKEQLEKKLGRKISFDEINAAVLRSIREKEEYDLIVDMDDEHFASSNLDAKLEIDRYLSKNFKNKPNDDMEYFRLIYESLVEKYLQTKEAIEESLNKKYFKLHIIGGGAKSELLCKMIAKRLKVYVLAGPFEASALGNILLQFKALLEINDINEGFELIYKNKEIKEYKG